MNICGDALRQALSADDHLRTLKKAWDELNRAEAEMSRLRGYPRMSFSMKADFNRESRISTEARRTINSILGSVK